MQPLTHLSTAQMHAAGVKQTARSLMHSIHSFSKLGEDLENVDRLSKGKGKEYLCKFDEN